VSVSLLTTFGRVGQALVRRKRAPVMLFDGATFLDAARILVSKRVPRVLVGDATGHVTNLITQSDVVKALHVNLDKLDPKILSRPISKFRRLRKQEEPRRIFTVQSDTRAIEAFCVMDYGDISAVPVVDADNRLLANISARDIRSIIGEDSDFPRSLYELTALEFAQQMHWRADTHAPLAVSLEMHHTFKDVLQTLYELRIHHVWVTNKRREVVYVLALRDVVSEVLEH